MYIKGEFLSRNGETIAVHIVTGGDRSEVVEIAPDSPLVQFPADSPVEVKSEVNDTFDVLLQHSATIRLLTRDFMPDLFGAAVGDVVVNIYKGGECVFAGYAEPQSYSQPYNELWDELEINCIDALGAMQYGRLNGGDWSGAWQRLEGKTFRGVLSEIFYPYIAPLTLLHSTSKVVFRYDGSKSVDAYTSESAPAPTSVFDTMAVSPAVFMGDNEDDAMTPQEVAETILRYLDLHICQVGHTFYIFDWQTIKSGTRVAFQPLMIKGAAGGGAIDIASEVKQITPDIVTDTDTTISIDEVYNRVTVEANIKEVSDLIRNPLSEGDLSAAHPRQLYMTERYADKSAVKPLLSLIEFYGDNKKMVEAYERLMFEADRGAVTITDWHVQAMTHKDWQFSNGSGIRDAGGSVSTDVRTADITDWWADYASAIRLVDPTSASAQTPPWAVVPNMLSRGIGAAILSVGKVEKKADDKDNSLVAKIDSHPVLIIGVNGNGYDSDPAKAAPSDQDIRAAIPVAKYIGHVGAVLSPADDSIINYVVISGKVALTPRDIDGDGRAMREYYHEADRTLLNVESGAYPHGAMPSEREHGRWYKGFSPFTGSAAKRFEFKWSAVGDGSDKVSKVAVLSCMLIVGDKCVVESGTQGQVSDFEWRRYKPLAECADEDEYYAQSFTIGFDPKIGDYLIGQEYEVQNNIHYSMGIDAEGMAIPVRKSDKVSGVMQFYILGPVNTIHDDITRRHKTFFRRTKWGRNSRLILPHVANVQIKDFAIKAVSDSGGLTTDSGKDVIYTSDVATRFDNPKEGVEFDITTALTREECRQLGILNKVALSSPIDPRTGELIMGVHKRGVQDPAKPEQLYVDAYYREYSQPRVIMEQSVRDKGAEVNIFNLYHHPAIRKTFFVQGISRDLIAGTARLTLKENDRWEN